MPMQDESLYGTNADQTANPDYCRYCYKDGAFTAEMDLDEMIRVCLPHMVGANPDLTEADAVAMMREYLPTLKRWKS